MKDGRTHLAQHAVDMETGAIVAVTLQGADVGDRRSSRPIAAAEQVEDAQATLRSLWKRSSVIRGIQQSDPDRPGRRGHPVLRVRAGQGAT